MVAHSGGEVAQQPRGPLPPILSVHRTRYCEGLRSSPELCGRAGILSKYVCVPGPDAMVGLIFLINFQNECQLLVLGPSGLYLVVKSHSRGPCGLISGAKSPKHVPFAPQPAGRGAKEVLYNIKIAAVKAHYKNRHSEAEGR